MTTSPVRDISWASADPERLPRPRSTGALRYSLVNPAYVDAISIHHTTGAGLPAGATIAQEIAYIRAIDTYHRTSRGLDAIGYQMMAFASGRVYVTAPLDRYGAAVALQNNHTLSIALPGDFTVNQPTPTHLHTAAHAIAHINRYLNRRVAIRSHRYWGGTACPGNTYAAWVPALYSDAINLHPVTTYTVRAGDTAYGIARAHGITFAHLQAINPGKPASGNWSLITPGEIFRVA